MSGAKAKGQPARALTLAAAAAQLRLSISAPLPPTEQAEFEMLILPAWESLGDLEGKNAWATGSAMSMEKAIQYSLEEPESTIPT